MNSAKLLRQHASQPYGWVIAQTDENGVYNLLTRAADDLDAQAAEITALRARAEAAEARAVAAEAARDAAWVAGRDKAWRSINGQVGKDLRNYDCKDAGEGYDLAIADAVEIIQALQPPPLAALDGEATP